MISKIAAELLNDTLNLIQLARETALARGNHAQAERFAPVAKDLQTLAANPRQVKSPASSAGILGQSDFQVLLNAPQTAPNYLPNTATTPADRSHIVTSMASSGMTELDIARHMGITREDVRLILSAGQARRFDKEGEK